MSMTLSIVDTLMVTIGGAGAINGGRSVIYSGTQILNNGRAILYCGTWKIKNPRWIKEQMMFSMTLRIIIDELFGRRLEN